ncbi:hypothetical protein GBAR_LOCUS17857, partial [Geodia barretti]
GFVCVWYGLRRERRGRELWGTRCSDRDWGGLVGVIKAPDHQTYTQAVHGVTNHSVLPHKYTCYTTLSPPLTASKPCLLCLSFI